MAATAHAGDLPDGVDPEQFVDEQTLVAAVQAERGSP